MRSLIPNRRQGEEGYIPQPRSALHVLRGMLGLERPAESLRSLSHWRRSPRGKAESR